MRLLLRHQHIQENKPPRCRCPELACRTGASCMSMSGALNTKLWWRCLARSAISPLSVEERPGGIKSLILLAPTPEPKRTWIWRMIEDDNAHANVLRPKYHKGHALYSSSGSSASFHLPDAAEGSSGVVLVFIHGFAVPTGTQHCKVRKGMIIYENHQFIMQKVPSTSFTTASRHSTRNNPSPPSPSSSSPLWSL